MRLIPMSEEDARRAHRQRCPYCDRPFNSGGRWKRHVEREVCKKSERERRAEAVNWAFSVLPPRTARQEVKLRVFQAMLILGTFLLLLWVMADV